eukprot:544175-Hanusia_phi.AAC.3
MDQRALKLKSLTGRMKIADNGTQWGTKERQVSWSFSSGSSLDDMPVGIGITIDGGFSQVCRSQQPSTTAGAERLQGLMLPLIIVAVKPGSVAAQSGRIQKGDFIIQVDKTPVQVAAPPHPPRFPLSCICPPAPSSSMSLLVRESQSAKGRIRLAGEAPHPRESRDEGVSALSRSLCLTCDEGRSASAAGHPHIRCRAHKKQSQGNDGVKRTGRVILPQDSREQKKRKANSKDVHQIVKVPIRVKTLLQR